jgi:cell cycle arrest protein BUB3
VGKYEQPEKVFSLDVVDNKIVVAMNNRHVYIYDIRDMSEVMQKRESSLKYQTRKVKCMPNGQGTRLVCIMQRVAILLYISKGYVCGSIEGRVAVEFFDPAPEAQAKKYAFKCHRQAVDGVDHVYAVNALAFHPM